MSVQAIFQIYFGTAYSKVSISLSHGLLNFSTPFSSLALHLLKIAVLSALPAISV
jgi:hypothetical protein